MIEEIRIQLDDMGFFIDKLEEAVEENQGEFISANIHNLRSALENLKKTNYSFQKTGVKE